MAKKPTIQSGLISRTTPPAAPAQSTKGAAAAPPADDPASDKVIAVSLALRTSEYATLQAVADQYGASRGSLMTVLMRRAMKDLAAGKIKLTKVGLKFVDP